MKSFRLYGTIRKLAKSAAFVPWRVVRVVDRAALEMPCPLRDPGFESRTLRQLYLPWQAFARGRFFVIMFTGRIRLMTLDNKLNITNSADLAREEERISKKKAAGLFEKGILKNLAPGKFSSLQAIHRYLFEDIYDFAGEVRTVNIAKRDFRFASAMYLAAALENIDRMPNTSFDEIVEKYVEMNIAHPFREGNGRSMRIWLDLMFKSSLGMVIDWSRIDREDYLLAMERSPVRDIEIKHLLKSALTNDTESRDIYMKGIDRSYSYEGYDAFRAGDL